MYGSNQTRKFGDKVLPKRVVKQKWKVSPLQVRPNSLKTKQHASSKQTSLHIPIPKSQFFSQSFESNLPTSLTHILPSTRGYSPRRPAAVMGTITGQLWHALGFSRVDGSAPDNTTKKNSIALPIVPQNTSPLDVIPWWSTLSSLIKQLLKRGENSP